jgi:quercetin dioxygenase-like cupin family protein
MKPKITLAAVSNVFSRMMHFVKAGDTEQGRKHNVEHILLLSSGSLNVVIDSKETKFTAPHMIYIQDGKAHELVALEDNTIACSIHALSGTFDNIVDPTMIPDGFALNRLEDNT